MFVIWMTNNLVMKLSPIVKVLYVAVVYYYKSIMSSLPAIYGVFCVSRKRRYDESV